MREQQLERRRLLVWAGALALGGLSGAHRAAAHGDAMEGMQHGHHHHMVPAGLKRRVANYHVPTLTLVRQDGVEVAFPKALDDGRPVILDFIYTSCTEICPVTSKVFSDLQAKLGKERDKVHMVSISIDPEYDTPARLTAYAKRYDAGPEWEHFTGTAQASLEMQKAFDVYRGDKMNHMPVTFLRAAPGKPWVRLEGFALPNDLVREYHNLGNVRTARSD